MSDWTEPGAHPVVPGVHRIPLPLPGDGLRAVNVYAVESAGGLTLIDAGWVLAESRGLLEESLAEMGCKLTDIDRFLVTHLHRDHYTQAVAVRRELGTKVALGAGERSSLDFWQRQPERHVSAQETLLARSGASHLRAQWVSEMKRRPTDLSYWEAPDEWLEAGTVDCGQRRLEVVPTPGHTRGHVVFADAGSGLLFAGDHVLPTITPSVGFEPVSAALPLGDFLHSLAKVRSLPDMLLLPAHGPVAPSVHRRVDELLEHHEERLEQCCELVSSGTRTAYQVAGELRWTQRGRPFTQLDLFNAVLATLETLAHLELLAARGRVLREEEDGVARFATA